MENNSTPDLPQDYPTPTPASPQLHPRPSPALQIGAGLGLRVQVGNQSVYGQDSK